MHLLISATRHVALAALIIAIGNCGTVTAAQCPTIRETLVGAFTGIPTLTVDANGINHVAFDGVGALSDMGNALCSTPDETYDPVLKIAEGHHVLTAENGCDEIVIKFTSTPATETFLGFVDGNPRIRIQFEATWVVASGKGRYRGAKGGGTLYVDAQSVMTPPVSVGLGQWAMWGEIELVKPRRWSRGCWK